MRRTLAFIGVLAMTAAALGAQAGVGAKYGSRDPRTCPDRTAPARRARRPPHRRRSM
ncbi:MAG: hypothetical protein ACR2MQ_07370 [Gemmatimonadaceae bacterium]